MIYMKIMKKGGGSREKGKEETKSMPHAPVMIPTKNATFNNISVISWMSDLLVEETGVPRENHRHAASH
jgi:hypothetical protein